MRKITALFAVLALAVSTTAVSAATFTLNPVVTAAFDAGFNPLPSIDTTTMNSVMRIFELDLQVTTANLAAGERGFGNVGFNLALGGTLTEGGAGGYQPNTATTDSNGAAPGGIVPLFFANADAGSNTSDLQGIFATVSSGITNPNASDMRVRIGQAGGPNSLGKVYVKWNANAMETVTVAGSLWSVLGNDGQFSNGTGTGGSVTFGDIPEPATLAMGGIGLIGLISVVRRRKA